ncbi:uncharacterized protein LOC124449465 [Xenia sp. Carnegie-2017]|uniref:uncharacterized protein LOC124449465 n=1 Tax=Xenia sp. Carnegie-2017 TaxID=2897299 RepID=UPI001F04DFA8|nr:uncharacterized protein LOC124449465 [Xenia sp. Carnegie-2017]
MTIRYAKLKMLKAGNVDVDEKELVKITTKDFVREGSVSKRGPRARKVMTSPRVLTNTRPRSATAFRFTPDRVYEFSAGTEDEREEWVKDLKKIVSTSLTEEDRKAITLSEDLERKKSQQSSLSRISQKFS